MRAVFDGRSRQGKKTARDYESYVDRVHMHYVGLDGRGWDRYLDSHLGFALEDGKQLDSLTKPLKSLGVAGIRIDAAKHQDTHELAGVLAQGALAQGALAPGALAQPVRCFSRRLSER